MIPTENCIFTLVFLHHVGLAAPPFNNEKPGSAVRNSTFSLRYGVHELQTMVFYLMCVWVESSTVCELCLKMFEFLKKKKTGEWY